MKTRIFGKFRFHCSRLLLCWVVSTLVLTSNCVLLETSQLEVLRDFRANGWNTISTTNDTYCENNFGFSCDDDGYVTKIDLSNSYAYKSIPESIGNLSKLVHLSLNDYYVNGSLPTSLGNLKNLTLIQLIKNYLSGSLPSSLGNLTNLKTLKLDSNYLSGEIPSSFGGLSSLQTLFISNNKLSGSIPDSLGNLTNLIDISLSSNQLTGNIPDSFGNLANLNSLTLSSNNLNGYIPSSLGNIPSLTTIDLSGNSLTGNIPLSFTNLTGLQSLILNSNQFSGSVQINFYTFKNLTSIDLSNNEFSGSLPTNFSSSLQFYDMAYNYFTGDAKIFLNNSSVCTDNITESGLEENCLSFSSACTKQNQRSSSACGKGIKTWVIIVITISSFFLFLMIVVIALWVAKKLDKLPHLPSIFVIEWIKSNKKIFKLKDVKSATNYFNAEHMIQQNSRFVLYFGKMMGGETYLVRRTNKTFLSKSTTFLNKVNTILRTNHSNLLNAVGYSRDIKEQIILFEYTKYSTLTSRLRLHNDLEKSPLSFDQRLQIAAGVGEAIQYLHTFLTPPMVHYFISSNNVFLDSDIQPKLGEYGQFSKDFDITAFNKEIAKNELLGYYNPRDGIIDTPSFEADIYSFGVLLLELLTGKEPIITAPSQNSSDPDAESSYIRLSDWAHAQYHAQGLQSVMDSRLAGRYDSDIAEKFLALAFKCLSEMHQRPNISDVVVEIGEILNPSSSIVSIHSGTMPTTGHHQTLSKDSLLDPLSGYMDSAELPPLSRAYGGR